MLRPCLARLPVLQATRIAHVPLVHSRHKSLTASIEQGIRGSQTPFGRTSSRRNNGESPRDQRNGGMAGGRIPRGTYRNTDRESAGYAERQRDGTYEGRKSDRRHQERAERQDHRLDNRYSDRNSTRYPDERREDGTAKHNPKSPTARPSVAQMPLTTAASQFIFGFSAITAAIKARRRKLYNLYMHSRGETRDEGAAMIGRATRLRLKITDVGDESLTWMDKISKGRPHNGVVLEASPLPIPPILELSRVSKANNEYSVVLGPQTKEDSQINGRQTDYTYDSQNWRYPFVIYVDNILDEGNLGNIARSAYFLGADAVITADRNTATWTTISIKASSGAAEAIQIFSVQKPADFLGRSSRNGWRIYAADAILDPPPLPSHDPSPLSALSIVKPPERTGDLVIQMSKSSQRMPVDHSPVQQHPTILVLGGEQKGLRTSLLSAAHYRVGIVAGRDTGTVGLDSLNVASAASIIGFEFMKRPRGAIKESVVEKLF